MKIEDQVREVFAELVEDAGLREAVGGEGIGSKLDRKITEELAFALMARWLVLAKGRNPADMVGEFTRIYRDHRAAGEGAIVAIVRLLNELGEGRKPSAPMIGEN
jgi:hypothetical protein